MAEEKVGNPPSVSKKLIKQWRWVAIGIAIVALAVISKRDINFDLGSSSTKCQIEVTADVLNVRAAPDVNSPSVEKLNRGKVVDAQSEVSNGFRKLGDGRWVALEFVKSTPACDAKG